MFKFFKKYLNLELFALFFVIPYALLECLALLGIFLEDNLWFNRFNRMDLDIELLGVGLVLSGLFIWLIYKFTDKEYVKNIIRRFFNVWWQPIVLLVSYEVLYFCLAYNEKSRFMLSKPSHEAFLEQGNLLGFGFFWAFYFFGLVLLASFYQLYKKQFGKAILLLFLTLVLFCLDIYFGFDLIYG